MFTLSLAFDIKWGKKIRDEMQAENSFITETIIFSWVLHCSADKSVRPAGTARRVQFP